MKVFYCICIYVVCINCNCRNNRPKQNPLPTNLQKHSSPASFPSSEKKSLNQLEQLLNKYAIIAQKYKGNKKIIDPIKRERMHQEQLDMLEKVNSLIKQIDNTLFSKKYGMGLKLLLEYKEILPKLIKFDHIYSNFYSKTGFFLLYKIFPEGNKLVYDRTISFPLIKPMCKKPMCRYNALFIDYDKEKLDESAKIFTSEAIAYIKKFVYELRQLVPKESRTISYGIPFDLITNHIIDMVENNLKEFAMLCKKYPKVLQENFRRVFEIAETTRLNACMHETDWLDDVAWSDFKA